MARIGTSDRGRRASATLLTALGLMAVLPAPTSFAQAASSAPDIVRLSASVEALVARVRPAVVQVLTTAYVPCEAGRPGGPVATPHATRSGVLVSADGYIVTNAHVVAGSRRVQVVLAPPGPEPASPRSILKPPGRALGAQVVGLDHESDLALLKVVETGLPFLSLGDSEALRQGQ